MTNPRPNGFNFSEKKTTILKLFIGTFGLVLLLLFPKLIQAAGRGVQIPNSGPVQTSRVSPKNYDWVKYQYRPGVDILTQASTAKAKGFKVLVSIVKRFDDFRPTPDGTCTPNTGQARFADFVAKTIRDLGSNVDAVELWNEPNLAGEWTDQGMGPVSAQAYGTLLKCAAAAAKTANPNVSVVSAGLSPAIGGSDLQFLNDYLSVSGLDNIDFIGNHVYVNSNIPPTSQEGGFQSFKPYLGHGKPLFITEFGFQRCQAGIDKATQTNYIQTAFQVLDNDFTVSVGNAIVWNWGFGVSTQGNTPEGKEFECYNIDPAGLAYTGTGESGSSGIAGNNNGEDIKDADSFGSKTFEGVPQTKNSGKTILKFSSYNGILDKPNTIKDSTTAIADTSGNPPPVVAYSGDDISSCEFYRGNTQASYKSQKVLSYFAEASKLSGMPMQVLAAIARVESPTLTGMNDDALAGYSCQTSPTGALGVMQIQPSQDLGGIPNAYCKSCVELGASFLGKTADTLTKADYCDIRESIILSAGFNIRKFGYAQKTNADQWDPSWTNDRAAINAGIKGYYGALKYPDPATGPYDYGEDVWKSIVSCQPKSASSSSSSNNSCSAGWPVTGSINQGPESADPIAGHARLLPEQAVDIGASIGSPVTNTFDGVVESVCSGEGKTACGGYGNVVRVRTKNGALIIYAHLSVIDKAIYQGLPVNAGQPIGLSGNSGNSSGPHLHYSFNGMQLATPNIPENITPRSCDSIEKAYGGVNCSPAKVTACSAAPATPVATGAGEYWFLLNRSQKYEMLFQGVPEKISQSKLIAKYPVNPGKSDSDPTPLPQKLGRRFWTTRSVVSYQPGTENYTKFGPYFIALDIPTDGYNAACSKKSDGTNNCFGPAPYKECGASGVEQCDWKTPGQFAIHGNNRLTDAGSAGCVRHNDADISAIYNTLSAGNQISGARYYIIDSNLSPEQIQDSTFTEQIGGI